MNISLSITANGLGVYEVAKVALIQPHFYSEVY